MFWSLIDPTQLSELARAGGRNPRAGKAEPADLGSSFFAGILGEAAQRDSYPPLRIFAGRGTVVVDTDLPGLRPEDVRVRFHQGVFEIEWARTTEEPSFPAGFTLRERRCGKFARRVGLPFIAGAARCPSTYANGVLEVRLEYSAAQSPGASAVTGDTAPGAEIMPRRRAALWPRTDIVEDSQRYLLRSDMAGADTADVRVAPDGRRVELDGHAAASRHEGLSLVHEERASGDYLRSFFLATPVDAARVESRLADGVLTVTLPKKAPATGSASGSTTEAQPTKN
jgi:HSP20 family protein